MSRDDHAIQLIEPWRPNEDRASLQCSQCCHKGEYQHVNISTQQYDVDRIFVGLSWELHGWWQLDRALEWWRTAGRQRAHNSTNKVSFYTIIVRLCHCMTAITRV